MVTPYKCQLLLPRLLCPHTLCCLRLQHPLIPCNGIWQSLPLLRSNPELPRPEQMCCNRIVCQTGLIGPGDPLVLPKDLLYHFNYPFEVCAGSVVCLLVEGHDSPSCPGSDQNRGENLMLRVENPLLDFTASCSVRTQKLLTGRTGLGKEVRNGSGFGNIYGVLSVCL